jgi:Ribbon-helix-helix protein, copG family
MKRLHIRIEEELDLALERQACTEGTSKAALIRRYIAEHVKALPPIEEDPLWELVGASPDVDPADIDEVVYGGKASDLPDPRRASPTWD